MNFFLPQNNQARIELAEIADVKKQIISPSTSGPIIGIIQDGLLGSFIMTQADMKIDWKMAMNMLAYTSIEDKRMKEIVKGRQYTGSEVFSMIIPQRLNCVAPVEIVNGKLIKGIVASSSLGSNKQNNLIHLIWDEYGVNETSQFIADVQRLTNFFNANNGFTIGIGDTVVPQKIHDEIKVLCNTTRLEMHHLLTQFENNPELFDAQTVETEIQSKMAVIRDNSAKLIMDNLSPKNSMIIMLTSGARGAATNIGQIIGILGQNSVEGKRIPKKVNNRSLAYFHQNDDTPDARGFIQRSYVEGVNPVSYIHHMMGAREGLIDTAVKTSESGYIQRKLVKAMEDLHIAYDNTVRTANNSIVQFIYGDTGLDTTKQYVHSISILTLGDTAVINKYKFTSDELKNIEFSDDENERYIPFIIDLRDNVRKSRMKTMIDNRTFDSNFQVPINFRNIIGYILNGPKLGTEMLSPRYIIKRLDDILTYDKTQILCIPKNKYKESIKYKDELTAKYAFRLALHDVLAPKRCIFEYKLDKKKFDSICDRIISTFNKSIVEAGEMVGTIAAQSIGEPTTQMTLNSVDWNEKILIQQDNKMIVTEIGKYIDEHVASGKNLEKIKDNLDNEMKDIYYVNTEKENISVISVDKDGVLKWNKVKALTKHLPINKDGTSDLVKITTRLGRTVTATKAKSFLTRINNEIVPIRGDELKVGMKVPITISFPEPANIINELDLSEYLPKTEYIYESELTKAAEYRKQQNEAGCRRWFPGNHGVLFTTPYSRSDALMDAATHLEEHGIKKNCVYLPHHGTNVSEIPEKIPLDIEFGFFVGAYLAEGCVTDSYISIANNDKKFRQRIIDWCDRYKIGTHIQTQLDKCQPGWTSIDVRVHSVVLTRLIRMVCGKGSEFKHVPAFAFNAPKDFISGLLNGYFSGDGTVSNDANGYISCGSISEELIDGISLLLTRFNIMSKKAKPTKPITNNRGSTDLKQPYTLSIRNENVHKFETYISMYIDEKKKRLQYITKAKFNRSNGRYDIIPGNNLDCIKGDIHRDDLWPIILGPQISVLDKAILIKAYHSNVCFDDVVSIDTVPPSHKFVYDFTVENTGKDDINFTLLNGFCVRDTFHLVGIASASTLGVPRLKELMSVTQNLKTPMMTIYLKDEYKTNNEIASTIASHIKFTVLKDVRKRISVYYDPDPHSKGGFMEKDNVYNVFHSLSTNKNACQSSIDMLPWLLRIEMDREKMLEKNITLIDIKSRFCNNWEKRYSDLKSVGKEEKYLLERILGCAILSNTEGDQVPIIHIRFDMDDISFDIIANFIEVFVDNFKIKGLKSIKNIYNVSSERVISFDNKDHELNESGKQLVIYTAGVNMQDIRYINGIDLNKIVINDIVMIYELYGIEAARAALIREFDTVFTRSNNPVNFHHVELLVDTMTNRGYLTSIDRHGLGRTEIDPLTRASFEKPVDQLVTSAVFSEIDYMRGVSSRIIGGLVINGGTNICKVALDTDLIQKSEFTEDIEQKYRKTFNDVSSDNIIQDIVNKDVNNIFLPF